MRGTKRLSLCFALWCASSSCAVEAADFEANPVKGVAPLQVTFCASTSIFINFGDGSGSAMQPAAPNQCRGGLQSAIVHVYQQPGQYRLGGAPCPGSQNTRCGSVASQASLTTIEVTG